MNPVTKSNSSPSVARSVVSAPVAELDACKRRLEALPGITGLWQVTARNQVSFNEMVRLDIEYIDNYSLWMDVKIILQTPWAKVNGNGAGQYDRSKH